MPKNVHTAIQLHSFHILARLRSKSFKLGFSNTWTKNFQMYSLGFKRGRGTRDQTVNICWTIEKAKDFQKNICFCFIDWAKVFDCVDHNKLWEILKEMGIPDHLTYLLWNLYASQEPTVRTGHGKMDWFKIGKGVWQGFILSPCLFNLYAVYFMWNIELDESQAWQCWLPREISTTSDMQMILL